MMISYLVTYFLEVGARFSLKVTTKPLLRENPKSLILGYFSKVEKEYCDQKKKKKKKGLSDNFGMLMSGFDAYFLEVSAHALLKIATKGSFGGEKSENLAFLDYFSEVEEYD